MQTDYSPLYPEQLTRLFDSTGVLYRGTFTEMEIAMATMEAGLGEVGQIEDISGRSFDSLIKQYSADYTGELYFERCEIDHIGYDTLLTELKGLFHSVEVNTYLNRIIVQDTGIHITLAYSFNEEKLYIYNSVNCPLIEKLYDDERITSGEQSQYNNAFDKFRFLGTDYALQYMKLRAKEVEFIRNHEG